MFPKMFSIGDFDMPTYGLLFSLAIIVGLWLARRNSAREGLDSDNVRNLGALVALSGILGARALAVFLNVAGGASSGETSALSTVRAGGAFLGGLLCAVVAGIWWMRRKRMPVLRTCDAFAPGIALGHAVGRIGCFAAGCCWGKPTETFWGVTFKNPLAHQWGGTPLGIPLVPTQLLESSAEFANFIILMWLFRNKKFDGQVIGAYFFLYGFARYGLEYLRDDPGRGAFFGGAVSGAQLICVALVFGAVFLWARSFSLFSSRLAK